MRILKADEVTMLFLSRKINVLHQDMFVGKLEVEV